jgi:ketosteroid isomerase-like protein
MIDIASVPQTSREKAMSSEDVVVVRSYLDALNRGDVTAAFAHLHPAIEFHEPDTVPYGGIYRGLEGMQRFLELVGEHLEPESVRVVPVEVFDGGGRVVARALLQARASASGVDFDAPLVEIVRVEDGRIREVLVYSDTARIMNATQATRKE